MALPYATEDQLKILERKTKADLDRKTANINLTANTVEDMNQLVSSGAVNDGQLCYLKENKKLYVLKDDVWEEVGGGIPVVEGTIEELTEEEQSGGAVAKWSIPTAQSNNFIFYEDEDEGWYFMSCLGGIYSCNFNVPGVFNYILYGTETFIYLLNNATSTNTIPYYVIENFNDGDHNDSSFVMPTEDVVLFTDGSDISLIGYKNGTSYICYEWKSVVVSGQYKYKGFMYRITESNVGYNIKITDLSEALQTNFEFLPNYSSSDNGKILAIDSGNPKWIASSSSSKTTSLFGRHSILVPLSSKDSDINLFSHSITSVNGNNQLLIQIYSSNNIPVNSPADLATVLVVYRKIIVSGIYENSPIFMLDWKGYASSVFYTVANPTTGIPLSTFTTFEDDVISI